MNLINDLDETKRQKGKKRQTVNDNKRNKINKNANDWDYLLKHWSLEKNETITENGCWNAWHWALVRLYVICRTTFGTLSASAQKYLPRERNRAVCARGIAKVPSGSHRRPRHSPAPAALHLSLFTALTYVYTLRWQYVLRHTYHCSSNDAIPFGGTVHLLLFVSRAR